MYLHKIWRIIAIRPQILYWLEFLLLLLKFLTSMKKKKIPGKKHLLLVSRRNENDKWKTQCRTGASRKENNKGMTCRRARVHYQRKKSEYARVYIQPGVEPNEKTRARGNDQRTWHARLQVPKCSQEAPERARWRTWGWRENIRTDACLRCRIVWCAGVCVCMWTDCYVAGQKGGRRDAPWARPY